jgi:hypothetical protein
MSDPGDASTRSAHRSGGHAVKTQKFRTIREETKEEEHYSIRRVAGSREDFGADMKGNF